MKCCIVKCPINNEPWGYYSKDRKWIYVKSVLDLDVSMVKWVPISIARMLWRKLRKNSKNLYAVRSYEDYLINYEVLCNKTN